MLPGLGAVRGTNAIDALRDECLLTDSVDIGHREVQDKACRQTKRNHRQKERHDLHDHLLLAIGLRSSRTPLNLALLDKARDCNDHNQNQERQCMRNALVHCFARTLREIKAKGLHLIGG